MNPFFVQLYQIIAKRKLLFVVIALAFLGSSLFIASHISFDEDITKILPKGEKSNTIARVLSQLEFSDKITVMIEAKKSESIEDLSEVAQLFLDSLRQDSLYYSDIQGKIDEGQINTVFDFVYNNIPLFLDEKDYEVIENKLSKDSIDKIIEDDYRTLISPTGIVARDFILKDPLGISFIGLNKFRELGLSNDFILNNGFISSADSLTLLIFITPSHSGTDTKANEIWVNKMYSYQNSINQLYEESATLTYFGAPFIATANEKQIKEDIKSTVIVSLSFLMFVLILFYRNILIPIILFIPTLFGASLALALLYFISSDISAISISIGAILLGITLDYSIHVVTHYREHPDIKTLYKNITAPLIGCSLTTSIAFLCLLFVKSKVLQDLGVFAAISILSSALFALIFIPHIFRPKARNKKTILDKIGNYKFDQNKVLVGVTVLAIILGIFTFNKVKFDNDISNLNFMPENMKASEKQLENIGSIGSQSIYLTVYGEDSEEIIQTNSEIEQQLLVLQEQGLIEDINSIGNFFLSTRDQKKRIEKWDDFWKNRRNQTLQYVKESSLALGFNEGAFSGFNHLLEKEYSTLSVEDYKNGSPLPLEEFFVEKDGFITLSTLIKTDAQHKPELIYLLEKDNVIPIDRKHINEQFLGQMGTDFKSLINYSFIAVFIILLIYFQRIELAVLGIIPIILTGIVTTGFIYLFNLELNIFSTIVTTLILGIGVDFSIFMTSGLQRKYTTGENELHIYRTSIILAVLTTLLSIGALIFAKHPALLSISWISFIGILSAMLITFTFYPLLFRFFIERRPKKGKSPISFRLLITAIISFAYFGLGGLILSFIAGIIFPLIPIKKAKKEDLLKALISKFNKSVMHSNFGTHNFVRNPFNETFTKPAIIIPNHSSFLDTLSIGFLKTKTIFLVNNWVYHSPVFGKAIREAGYFPTNQGIDNNEDAIVESIKSGNYLVVFPEGTRSPNGAIARFHKGAFHLAQKHNIDIVPLYIHGNFNLLPKNDFIIFDGKHTLEIGERISLEEIKENEIRDITKEVSQKFRERFQQLRYELEDENYFKDKIHLNFLYKTASVRKQAKQEFEENKLIYHQLNFHIDGTSSILRIGNDLGIWDLMLVLQKQNRKVYSYISNSSSRNIAKQTYLLSQRKLHYFDSIETMDIEKVDFILISEPIDNDLFNQLIESIRVDKIITLSNTIDSDILTKLGYQIETKETYFTIFKHNQFE